MSIKRVFLPLCDDAGIEPAVKAAFFLGRMFSAQVCSLFVQRLPVVLPAVSPGAISAETIHQITENIGKELAEIENRAQGVVNDYARRLPEVDSVFASGAEPIANAVRHGAFLADLSVLGSWNAFTSSDWSQVHDAALFESGRPVFLVPPDGIDGQNFDRVVIAWKESVEAARAIAAAQPFLEKAKEVHLVTVGDGARAPQSLQDAEQYLQLHYANVQSETVSPSSESIGETLLGYARDKGNAMLVMGAYSHWRWRELVFGGATEHVMRNATVPLLMAH